MNYKESLQLLTKSVDKGISNGVFTRPEVLTLNTCLIVLEQTIMDYESLKKDEMYRNQQENRDRNILKEVEKVPQDGGKESESEEKPKDEVKKELQEASISKRRAR